jgi:chromosomal replication initiation ATPase DnaA
MTTSRSDSEPRPPRNPAADVIDALAARGLLELLERVCARRGVTPLELCGHGRTRSVAAARQELWWLIRRHPERSYSFFEIARLFGRDHTTVLHGVAAHQRRFAASARSRGR